MDVLKELDKAGAVVLDRHFIYTSGKHGSGYINLDIVFPQTALMAKLADGLVEPFIDDIDTVAAPAVGGVVLTVLAARAALERGRNVNAVWADKDANRTFTFERAGFERYLNGKRVLVVEDLMTTGSSVEAVCREAERHGARIAGVSVVCNRGGVTAEQLGVPRFESLASAQFESEPAETCTLCASNTPIVDHIGHGAKYKADHPDYGGGYISLTY